MSQVPKRHQIFLMMRFNTGKFNVTLLSFSSQCSLLIPLKTLRFFDVFRGIKRKHWGEKDQGNEGFYRNFLTSTKHHNSLKILNIRWSKQKKNAINDLNYREEICFFLYGILSLLLLNFSNFSSNALLELYDMSFVVL